MKLSTASFERSIMKTQQLIISTLLASFALSISGCAIALVGAGAAAGVGYIKGDLEATLEDDVEDVYRASLQALNKLKLAVISRQMDALSAKITSRTSEDKKIQIKIKRIDRRNTKLAIRIGVFGNETKSRIIYDKIKENL
jgi:hypothetical protein